MVCVMLSAICNNATGMMGTVWAVYQAVLIVGKEMESVISHVMSRVVTGIMEIVMICAIGSVMSIYKGMAYVKLSAMWKSVSGIMETV
mmetsp:Transcript_7565/g.982  ORF Transcript_7565/g.982 Transcript_7565/m.982 type:complete len:88 (+) Transcript_7565:747-1010(+)